MKQNYSEDALYPSQDITSLASIIKESGKEFHFSKGQTLFAQDSKVSALFWINKGLVKLYQSENKKRCSILKVEKENGFAGLSDCFGGDTHQFGAEAITPAEVIIIDLDVANNILYNEPEFSQIIINYIALETRFYLQRFSSRLHKQLPGRVAETLLFFHRLFDEEMEFELPLSRAELAQFAGTTKESFIRTLTEFRNDRIINIEDRKIDICSLDIVKTLSRLG